MPDFRVVSDFQPTGDQPVAIDKLVDGFRKGLRYEMMIPWPLIRKDPGVRPGWLRQLRVDGFAADRLSLRSGDRRWYMWTPGIATLAMIPVQFFAYLGADLRVVLPSLAVTMFLAAVGSLFLCGFFSSAEKAALREVVEKAVKTL